MNKIQELEQERERLSKLLIEARMRIVELEEGIKAILSDLKNRREYIYVRRWDMEVVLGELLGIKSEDL